MQFNVAVGRMLKKPKMDGEAVMSRVYCIYYLQHGLTNLADAVSM